MNWDDLKLFLAVGRAGRLAIAAKAVGQDATTVSRRIRRLEQSLQARLFEHTPSGHVLTDQGATLFEAAERMEAAALGIQREVTSDAAGLAGSIRISASEGFGSRIIAPHLGEFTRAHPQVQIDLIASSGVLNPSRREADIAVMLARPKAGPLISRKLTDYALGLYASPAYLERAPRLASPADLSAHALIGYVPDQIFAPELRYLSEIGSRLEATIRSSSINAQAEMIESGVGCGVLPCFIGDTMDGVVRVLPDIMIERSFWLVVHRDLRGIARIDRFLAWLTQRIDQLRPLMSGRGRS
ncbi:LysR family transcriptional regulator [Sphingomonas sp. AOB5]|uniref:LysR family transcriptional regulator n=1 Tax=Sphingomonas sp. AOB5 TaxID=3034017 RepID=UPI0023F7030C|nr:LysR family transcriptional regulator [Sphingomonas sp. AOB5]MDF7777289.1 LysR family transcriptional regulator [Sphingomonas sp. AOB5]